MVIFNTGDTVIRGRGKRTKVGNIVYFKTPAVAFVRYACERSAFVSITKLRKANGKMKPIKKASKCK